VNGETSRQNVQYLFAVVRIDSHLVADDNRFTVKAFLTCCGGHGLAGIYLLEPRRVCASSPGAHSTISAGSGITLTLDPP
jgi:hypothetical protein